MSYKTDRLSECQTDHERQMVLAMIRLEEKELQASKDLDAAEKRLHSAVDAAEQAPKCMTLTVALIEMHRKNENGGLSLSDMQYFANRIEQATEIAYTDI